MPGDNAGNQVNVEVVNFLISKGIMKESKAAVRLPALFEFLKSRFALTDNLLIFEEDSKRRKREKQKTWRNACV